MTYILCGAVGVILGSIALLIVLCVLRNINEAKHKSRNRSGKRSEPKESGKHKKLTLKEVTNFLFVTTQVCALIWVFTSYGIALYSTVVLRQVYTMAELSEPAITTLLAVLVTKVVANMFEHNDGGIFGTSHKPDDSETSDGIG